MSDRGPDTEQSEAGTTKKRARRDGAGMSVRDTEDSTKLLSANVSTKPPMSFQSGSQM